MRFPTGHRVGGEDADDGQGAPVSKTHPTPREPVRAFAGALSSIAADAERLSEILGGTSAADAKVAQEARALVGKIRTEAERLRTLLFADAGAARPSEPFTEEPATAPRRRTPRVLVVDDEPGVVRAITRVLREFDVVATERAEVALALIEQGERFDAIVSDVMMPEMTGMDLHAAIARVDREQAHRMIFVTGGGSTTRTRDFVAAMSERVIHKPFGKDALRELVQRTITKAT